MIKKKPQSSGKGKGDGASRSPAAKNEIENVKMKGFVKLFVFYNENDHKFTFYYVDTPGMTLKNAFLKSNERNDVKKILEYDQGVSNNVIFNGDTKCQEFDGDRILINVRIKQK